MDIDAKTLLLVLIIVVGSLFLVLIFNYSLFDTSDYNELSETNSVEIASTSRQNTIKESTQYTSDDTAESSEETTEETTDEIISETDSESIEEQSDNFENIPEESMNSNDELKTPANLSKIEKNNPSPKLIFNENEKYVERGVRFSYLNSYCSLSYRIPDSWVSRRTGGNPDGMSEANIRYNGYFLSEFGEFNEYEITYDEFLNVFMKKEKLKDSFPNYVEFNIRDFAVSASETFPVVEKTSYNTITSYMVFIRDGRVFTLEITVSKDKYNNYELMRKLDNVLNSAYIRY